MNQITINMAELFEAEKGRIKKLQNELAQVKDDILIEIKVLYSLKDYSDTLSEEAAEMIYNISGPDELVKHKRYQDSLSRTKGLILRKKELEKEIKLSENYLKSLEKNVFQVKVFFLIVGCLLVLFIYFRFIK